MLGLPGIFMVITATDFKILTSGKLCSILNVIPSRPVMIFSEGLVLNSDHPQLGISQYKFLYDENLKNNF